MRHLLLIIFLLAGTWLSAQNPIPPKRDYLVHDYADLFSRNEEVALGEKLAAYARETSTQIVVLTEQSLKGDDAFQRSVTIAQEWGIGGSAEKDNGVLIYVAKDDRAIRIQTGYGAEGFLPDAMAKRLIDQIITPAFRNGDFYGGIDRVTDAIKDLAKGEYVAEPGDGSQGNGIPPIFVLFFILFIFVFLSGFARNDDDDDDDEGGYWRNGRYEMDDPHRGRRRRRRGGMVIFPGGFGGGGFGGGGGGGLGGFGGGGFGGFGGGGFGGGGAGGSW